MIAGGLSGLAGAGAALAFVAGRDALKGNSLATPFVIGGGLIAASAGYFAYSLFKSKGVPADVFHGAEAGRSSGELLQSYVLLNGRLRQLDYFNMK